MWELAFETIDLAFIKPAKTSRGVYENKKVGILTVKNNNKIGKGEVSPLPDLSIDGHFDFYSIIQPIQDKLNALNNFSEIFHELKDYPALCFGLECALRGIKSTDPYILFDSPFTQKKAGIPINGLVWMNSLESMQEEGMKKWAEGYKCIKFKIGSFDFDAECRLIEKFRKLANEQLLELRVDANGAFHPSEAKYYLKELDRFKLHSIEQPIAKSQWDAMEELCATSPVPIALDEELIGINTFENKLQLIKKIKPSFLVLKPTLLGGFTSCDEWVQLANKYEMGWWVTSALESNLGLSAIAQWVSIYPSKMFQGLGTGALYTHNLPAHTVVSNGELIFTYESTA